MGVTQYRYTVRKIGKYRNTVSTIDEISEYRIYDWSCLLNVVSISRVFFISSMYTPEINLSLRGKTEALELIGTMIEKPGY